MSELGSKSVCSWVNYLLDLFFIRRII